MFERILVPLDGFRAGGGGAPQDPVDPPLGSTEVLLLFHALDPWTWTGHSTLNWETIQDLRLKVDEDARTYLSKIEARLSAG